MIQKEILPNGLTLLSESIPHVRSVTIGVWLKRGSRHETPGQGGISHFIEHMVFKGTARRSAEQIAEEVDSIGGLMDAFTAKEYAAFHLKVLDQHLPLAVDILGDIVLNPRFDPKEIAKEKQVVFEEMAMVEDTPDDLVMELFTEALWPDHALGRPILGTRAKVARFDKAELLAFFRQAYHAGNLVVAAAGHLQHAQLRRLVQKAFAGLAGGPRGPRTRAPKPRPAIVRRSKPALEQVHVCLGTPAPHQTHRGRFAAHVLNTVLGGSMSSRLFQNVREKRALAYSISSGIAAYADTGNLTIYAGTRLETLDELLRLCVVELQRLKAERVPEAELRRAKDNLKGGLTLSLESTGSRMSFLARQEIYFGELVEIDDVLSDIEAVDAKAVQRMAHSMFAGELTLSVLGNLKGYRPKRSLLRI
jgi:predicted Zn-dependent peptidase